MWLSKRRLKRKSRLREILTKQTCKHPKRSCLSREIWTSRLSITVKRRRRKSLKEKNYRPLTTYLPVSFAVQNTWLRYNSRLTTKRRSWRNSNSQTIARRDGALFSSSTMSGLIVSNLTSSLVRRPTSLWTPILSRCLQKLARSCKRMLIRLSAKWWTRK